MTCYGASQLHTLIINTAIVSFLDFCVSNLCSTPPTVFDTQRSTHSIRPTAFDPQRSTHSVRPTAFDLHCLTHNSGPRTSRSRSSRPTVLDLQYSTSHLCTSNNRTCRQVYDQLYRQEGIQKTVQAGRHSNSRTGRQAFE